MADLSDKDASLTVKLTGADTLGAETNFLNVDASGNVGINDGGNSITIDATSLPLPTGAATSSLQTAGNNSLASIDSKLTSPLTVQENKVALTGIAPATSNVTTTSSTILAANSSRRGLVITNLSTNRVFLAFGANAAINNGGITLVNGGTYVMDAFTFSTQSIQARTASGTSTLSIQEFQ